MFTFKSEYGEEDIEYSLSEIFTENAVTTLVTRARIFLRSADHIICTLTLREVDGQNFTWRHMNASDSEVLREIVRM